MPTYTQEQLIEKYKNLPPDVQEAMSSVDTADAIQKIGAQNGLNVEKMGILARETAYLMLDITPPNEFISYLEKELGVAKEVANKIGQEVNTQIFSKIRESLKRIHEQPPQASPTQNNEEKLPNEETGNLRFPKIINPHVSFKNGLDEIFEPMPQEKKDIVEERNKDQVLRSKPQTTEKVLPASPADKPQVPQPQQPKYKENDPYREPIN